MRVMLVDDSITARNIARRALQALGIHEFIDAADGREALRVLQGCAPADGFDTLISGRASDASVDLIILDWQMPRLDGLAFLDEIRHCPRLSQVPVLMVTVEKRKPKVVEALQRGAAGYLLKPFRPEQLADEVRRILKQVEIARQRAIRPVDLDALNTGVGVGPGPVVRSRAWNE